MISRKEELELRETAQQQAKVVKGSGRMLPPKKFGHVISIRLQTELISQLRELADARGVSISDLMRNAAKNLIETAARSQYEIYSQNLQSSKSSARWLYQTQASTSGSALRPTG